MEDAMNVNNINNNETASSRLNFDQTSGSARTEGVGSSQKTTGGAGASTDSISLTSSNLVQQALNSGSDARAARIQQLRALIQNNQYNPSAQEVSRSLVNAHIAGE
jgi:anti-sigma28 factor (negative regulator of flagellin synthesis)